MCQVLCWLEWKQPEVKTNSAGFLGTEAAGENMMSSTFLPVLPPSRRLLRLQVSSGLVVAGRGDAVSSNNTVAQKYFPRRCRDWFPVSVGAVLSFSATLRCLRFLKRRLQREGSFCLIYSFLEADQPGHKSDTGSAIPHPRSSKVGCIQGAGVFVYPLALFELLVLVSSPAFFSHPFNL